MTSAPAVTAAECGHTRGHIVDSYFFGDRYATPASRRIFCDVCRVQRWLDVEVALAAAQAELGLIPRDAADGIAGAARLPAIDLAEVRAETERTGHSLVGLLRVLQRACPEGAGEFIHLGATTQDIQDTGQVLEMREVLDEMELGLTGIVARLVELAEEHAGTVALGRTHARPALPITFGLKVAGWLDEIVRQTTRIRTMRDRVLVAQLFGGAGTMAGFGADGPALLDRFAARLGLAVPAVGWHTARDRVAEYVSVLAMTAGSLARIAEEVRILGRPEFGEVSEAWQYGKVGSSTMPHKRNPERCEQVAALAKLAAAQAGIALAGLPGDHERDSRTLRVEWSCVPDVSHYSLAATAIAAEIVSGLTVHPDRLRRNLAEVADQVASERLMLALGERLGKQTAHERVYDLSQRAQDTGTSLREQLAADPGLRGLLPDAEVEAAFGFADYLGACVPLTQRAVADARKWLGDAPATPGR